MGKLGAFQLGRKLGQGGMATVYAARQDLGGTQRLVALKVLAATGDDERKAFLREAQAATRLEHANIVRTYEAGAIDGSLYVAMELVHGASLLACERANNGPVPTSIAVRVAADMARALHKAHEHGAVHLHVSPQNVLISYDGIVKVADFGVVRQTTDAYSSPEQIDGATLDRRSDVFALGILLWEMLCAERLFRRETPAATARAIQSDPVPDVRVKNPAVPMQLAAIVARALERDPSARYATAEAFRGTLSTSAIDAGLRAASEEELATWVRSLAAASFAPADLEREIASGGPIADAPAASSASASRRVADDDDDDDMPMVLSPKKAAASRGATPPPPQVMMPAPAPPPPPALALPLPEVPDLAPAPVRPSGQMNAVRVPARAAAPPSTFGAGDDDDFDMQIERHTSTSAQPAMSSRGSFDLAADTRARGGPIAATASGLEVAHDRLRAEREAHHYDDEPSMLMRVLGWVLATAALGGTAYGLFVVAHHRGAFSLAQAWPHAVDGTSAPDSGAFSLIMLFSAVILGYVGVKVAGRSWALLLSAAAMLLMAIAMVTVTLGSSGENATPPDGVLLLPYLVPFALLCFAFGIAGRSARLFAWGSLGKKFLSLPVAALAGAIAFIALESSKLVP